MEMTNLVLSPEQQDAVDQCVDMSKRIVCVTGQAGTGKTTILKNAYDTLFDTLCNEYGIEPSQYDHENYSSMPFSIRLAAPTGRAAKRIEEATGIRAMTIHHMMRFSMPEDDQEKGLPAHTKHNPLPYTAIFIDEASMLTEELRRQVIDAMLKGCVIRFFGDINQLPPIGSASPFAQDLKRFPSVQLTKNYRSTDGIIDLADRVIKNKMPMSNDQVRIERIATTQTQGFLLKAATEIDFTSDVNQIISPTNKTKHGTETINRMIQQRFNPEQEKIQVFHRDRGTGQLITRTFKRGDKVLWTKNDYNVNIMNGTLGRVMDFDQETGHIILNIEGSDIEIPSQIETFNEFTKERITYDPRHYLDLGYAISTHKAQGSQFDLVMYVLSRSRAATRQNVYTGVTRAKHKLIIVNISGALAYALDNPVDLLKAN